MAARNRPLVMLTLMTVVWGSTVLQQCFPIEQHQRTLQKWVVLIREQLVRSAGGLGERMCLVGEKGSGGQGKRVKVTHFLGFSRRISGT